MTNTKAPRPQRATLDIVAMLQEAHAAAGEGDQKARLAASLNSARTADAIVKAYSHPASRPIAKLLIETIVVEPELTMMVIANLVAACSRSDRFIAKVYETLEDVVTEEAINDAAENAEVS
jgi:hypothetical protein